MQNLRKCCFSETDSCQGLATPNACFRHLLLLFLMFQCILPVGCGRSPQQSSEDASRSGNRSSVDQAFAADGTLRRLEGKIIMAPDAGPPVQFVASFFENWKQRRFEAMHGQMINAGEQARFCSSMKKTPVQWRSVQIGSGGGPDGEADVALHIEVTDLASVMGAYYFCNARNSPVKGLVSLDKPFPATPFSLNIETFCVITQSWHLVQQDGAWKIDYGSEREMNIMHYFVDAGGRTYAKQSYEEASPGMPPTFMFQMARVLQMFKESLGVPSSDDEAVIADMKKKADQAVIYYRRHLQ